ncbi:hypothetical protein RclHR1_08550001 [Rhizophagus clarus]|uniref:Uncharacterized protein n=1 Tax=Rhizophagus clarus TaxID=94130 RepID=A0A2Z6SC62_9GLOM|nr:hypothetical protein RclHR1_08550001 [Rhizophagus clarus]
MVMFSNFQHVISSTKSATDAAIKYEQLLKLGTKVKISGSILFGLQLDSVRKAHKSRKRENLIKPAINSVDQGQISRESYRELAAVEGNLPHKNSVSNKRIAITDNINQLIKILLVDMNGRDKLEEALRSDKSEFRNPEITREAIDIIGIGIYRSIKDIFNYIIPYLKEKKVLRLSDMTIHLRISGDEHNVKLLYPGTEKYNTLEFILNPFFNELRLLKKNGLEAAGILWNFELYFSFDWKFLAIYLGLNGPTSNYFCFWYSCSKHQHSDLSKDWHIEKNMEQIATRYEEVNDHIHPLLIDMIAINHIIFDELHVFLRIID